MNLVIGASGKAGSRVATRLLERGEPVRAVSRDPSGLAQLERLGAEVVRGDLLDGEWMDGALRDIRRLVLASQGLVPPTRSNSPPRADDEGNRRIIDAAARAGVERVVFVSTALAAPDSPALFGRLKHRVEVHLAGSGLAHTIVRATTFIETHALTLLAEPLLSRGKVTFMGRGRTQMNWVSADDLARYIVGPALDPAGGSRTVVVGGPDVMSRLQALEIVERALGRRARRSHIPIALLRGARVTAGPLHTGLRYLLDAAVVEDAGGAAHWAPRLDWTGRTTVGVAVRRWVSRARSGALPAG